MSCHVRNGEVLTFHSTHVEYKGRRYNLSDCALHNGSKLRIEFVNVRHGDTHTAVSVTPPPPELGGIEDDIQQLQDSQGINSEEISAFQAQMGEVRELVAQLQTEKAPPTEVNLIPLWGVLAGWILISIISKLISSSSRGVERQENMEARKKRDNAMVALNKRLNAVESILLGAPPESGSDS